MTIGYGAAVFIGLSLGIMGGGGSIPIPPFRDGTQNFTK